MSTENASAEHDPTPSGRIFSVQHYCLHDGPGIRTTVFMKGCPLSCGWCHNPEGRAPGEEIWIVEGRCISCGSCLEDCPHPIPIEPGETPTVDRQLCVRCGSCVQNCPTGARQMLGRSVTTAELMTEFGRDLPFFEQSGGGVTFSGGEPLLQREFLLACLSACRKEGIHTAVDTSGFAPRNRMLELALWTDLVLFDLKLVDNSRHIAHTGVPVTPILENLDALDAAGVDIWIRLPFIPGVNDDQDNLAAVAGVVNELEHARRVHLLPFHATGNDKHGRLGRNASCPARDGPTRESLAEAAEVLVGHGLDVHVGG